MHIWHIVCASAVREQDLFFHLYHSLIFEASSSCPEDCSTAGF